MKLMKSNKRTRFPRCRVLQTQCADWRAALQTARLAMGRKYPSLGRANPSEPNVVLHTERESVRRARPRQPAKTDGMGIMLGQIESTENATSIRSHDDRTF